MDYYDDTTLGDMPNPDSDIEKEGDTITRVGLTYINLEPTPIDEIRNDIIEAIEDTGIPATEENIDNIMTEAKENPNTIIDYGIDDPSVGIYPSSLLYHKGEYYTTIPIMKAKIEKEKMETKSKTVHTEDPVLRERRIWDETINKMERNKPKLDGSGGGTRANINRGECDDPKEIGQGQKYYIELFDTFGKPISKEYVTKTELSRLPPDGYKLLKKPTIRLSQPYTDDERKDRHFNLYNNLNDFPKERKRTKRKTRGRLKI